MVATDYIAPEPRACPIRLARPLWITVATVALIVVACGLRFGVPFYRERVAMHEIERLGGRYVTHRGGPDWLRRLVGNERMEIFGKVYQVDLRGKHVTNAELKCLTGLSNLTLLQLEGTEVTYDGVADLKRAFPNLNTPTPFNDDPDPDNEGLVVAQVDLDFGNVGETRKFAWQFNILNPTDQAIRIDGWQSFCSQRIESKPVTVPARGEAAVHVTLDLTPRDSSDFTAIHEQRRRVEPIIRGRRKRGWTIHGRSHRAFAVSTPMLKFDDGSAARREQFTVTMLRPDVTVDIECEPSIATIAVERHVREPRITYSVEVTSRGNRAGGSFPIQIRSSQFDGMSASNSIWAGVE